MKRLTFLLKAEGLCAFYIPDFSSRRKWGGKERLAGLGVGVGGVDGSFESLL